MPKTLRWLLTGSLLSWGLWSCVPTDEPDDTAVPTSAPHENFPILGGHRAVECEDCHITGAQEQGLPSDEPNGWVTLIGTDCLGCHTDTRDEIFPNGHKQQASCANSGCHSGSDDCWRSVRGDCIVVPTGEPPPPIGHEGERAILFPLEGPHDVEGCATCHTGTADEEQRGGHDNCEMCHDRPSPDHYAAERNRAPNDERMCKACHAAEAADGKLEVHASFGTADGAVVHDLYWPHNRIAIDNAPYPLKGETSWVSECIDCHQTPGVQDASGATCDYCHVDDGDDDEPHEMALPTIHDVFGGPCVDCHARGDNLGDNP